MSETYSGTATYPTLPLTLAVDGETINHSNLIKDAAAGTGWIGKLLDHTVTNRARLDRLLSVNTDGSTGDTGAITATGLAPTFTSDTMTNSAIVKLAISSTVVGDVILVYATAAWKDVGGTTTLPRMRIHDGTTMLPGSLAQPTDLNTPNAGIMSCWGMYTVASAGTKTFTVQGADSTTNGWAFYEPWRMIAITIRA